MTGTGAFAVLQGGVVGTGTTAVEMRSTNSGGKTGRGTVIDEVQIGGGTGMIEILVLDGNLATAEGTRDRLKKTPLALPSIRIADYITSCSMYTNMIIQSSRESTHRSGPRHKNL